MGDEKTVLERLAEAMNSGDLTHRSERCAVDYVGALGMAGRHHRQGAALLALELRLSAEAVPAALKASNELVRQVAQRQGWTLTPMKLRRIALEALRFYLRPVCESCQGRGQVGLEHDAPGRYRPERCPVCGGTGRKPLPSRYRREIRAVLYVMENERRAVGAVVRSKMRLQAPVE